MKIVFLKARASFRGGLEKYTSFLAQAFAREGHSVTLLTTGTPPKIPGIEAVSLAPDTSFTLRHLRRFDRLCQKWLRDHPAPIVFGMERTTEQTHYRAGNGVHAVFLERRKLIDPLWKQLTLKINPLHLALLSMERKAFESPHLKKLFTNSHMVADEIVNHYELPQEKLEVVHNGVEWQAWSEPFEKRFPRERQKHHFLFVGNGYRRKGLTFLLQGLSLIHDKEFHLTIVGKDKNIPYFIQLAEQLGLQENVSFLGPQPTLLPFYQQADTLVIPSIYDPFANVTLEALAMGLFVVSSTYNGGKEILLPHTGTLIEDLPSPQSIKSSLEKAMNRDLSEASTRAIRNSIQHLDFSHQLDKIVRLTLSSSK